MVRIPIYYDRPIKGLLREAGGEFLRYLLGLKIRGEPELLPTEYQIAKRKELDFLYRIKRGGGKPDLIQHLEIQSGNDPKMAYRMFGYLGILVEHYPDAVISQAVIYIGTEKLRMPDALMGKGPTSSYNYKYKIIELSKVPARQFLKSDNPAIVIFSILMKYGDTEELKERITARLKSLKLDPHSLIKYLNYLEALAKIRKIKLTVKELIRKMDVQIDIREMSLYREGLEEGRRKGLEEGRRKGLEEGRRKGLIDAVIKIAEKRFGKSSVDILKDKLDTLPTDKLEELAVTVSIVKDMNEFLERINGNIDNF